MKTGKADCRPAQGEAAGARVKKPDTERENPPAYSCRYAGKVSSGACSADR